MGSGAVVGTDLDQGRVMRTPTLRFDGDIQDPRDEASVQWTQEGALLQAIMERATGLGVFRAP